MGNRTILITAAILFFLGVALGYLIGVASSPSSQATMTTSPGLTHTTETTTTSTSTVTFTQTPTTSIINCQTSTSSCQCTGIEYLQITYAFAVSIKGGWEITLMVENKGTGTVIIDQVFVNGVPLNNTNASVNITTLSIEPGGSAKILITLNSSAFVPGQQVEIKLHAASGKEYLKMVTLP